MPIPQLLLKVTEMAATSAFLRRLTWDRVGAWVVRSSVQPRVRVGELTLLRDRYAGEPGAPCYVPFEAHNESSVHITIIAISYRLLDQSEVPLEAVNWHQGDAFGTNGQVIVGEPRVNGDGGVTRIEVRTLLPAGTRVKVDGTVQFNSFYGKFTVPINGEYFDIPYIRIVVP